MKVADYIIKYLADYGVDDMFVVYGAANGDLIDAFVRTDNTRYISVMHEQGGGFAAEGWAKIKGLPSVSMATSGPGGMNFVTPIGNFFYDSIPGIFITGQINSRFMRPDSSIRQIGFQETDIINIVKPITKYAKLIEKPEDVKYELEKALYMATEGRPGPVLLDIPLDIQKADIDVDTLIGYDGNIKTKFDEDLINKQIDIYLEDGGVGRNFGIQNSDLLLAIGSRISGRITGGNIHSFAREAKKYMVDVDKAGLQRFLQQVPFEECIYSDAKLFIEILMKRLKEVDVPEFTSWTDKVMGWKKQYDPVTRDMFKPTKYPHPYAFTRILSEEMKENDVLAADCGGNIVVCNHAFETKTGQRYFTNNGNSPMGFSFAGGLGAALAADKSRNVVCVIGDGGFNMNIQELQTLVNYDIPLKTIIMNNHIYGITKAFQETNFQGRAEACGPVGYNPPNFVDIIKAYNIPTMTIDNGKDYDEVRSKIREFLEYDGRIVLDFNCHEYHQYSPRVIGWETPIEDMYPYLDEDEFKSNMFIEPLKLKNGRFYPSFVLDEQWGDE